LVNEARVFSQTLHTGPRARLIARRSAPLLGAKEDEETKADGEPRAEQGTGAMMHVWSSDARAV
jgi:hypothetical protein